MKLRLLIGTCLTFVICLPSYADRYAFLVGVRDYSIGRELNSLKFAEDDVQTLASTLKASGMPSENIVLMTQKASAKNPKLIPRSDEIRQQFDQLIQRLRPGDAVIVAFSGHGVQFNGEAVNYFCPIDARLDDKSTLLSLTDMYEVLEKSPALTKVMLVDACRNDPLAAGARSATRTAVRPSNTRSTPEVGGGAVAIFSCSATQQSFETPELESGVFFHFVNRAFAGDADDDEDGEIDLLELEFFTIKSVQKWARVHLGEKQIPERRGQTSGATTLASVPLHLRKLKLESFTNTLGMKLVLVPAGEFMMGSTDEHPRSLPDEKPLHRVKISKPYFLATTEVTQAQWKEVMKELPKELLPMSHKGANYPVVNVTWELANKFCEKLSALEGRQYVLPTEAEWEFACRAYSTTLYSFGDDPEQFQQYGWSKTSPKPKVVNNKVIFSRPGPGDLSFAQEVGQKKPNAFGLFDMHGNVHEWCADWYSHNYYGRSPEVDPTGPKTGSVRVFRGGAMLGPEFSYSAFRNSVSPSARMGFYDVGLRVKVIHQP